MNKDNHAPITSQDQSKDASREQQGPCGNSRASKLVLCKSRMEGHKHHSQPVIDLQGIQSGDQFE
jgi:hypothetical protein